MKNELLLAMKDFDERLRIDPQLATARSNRGGLWTQMKVYDKAFVDLDEAIRLNPNDANSFVHRANAWRNLKEYDKAVKDYSEAIKLNPKNPAPFHNRGVALAMQKQFDKAILDFDQAIRLNPNSPAAFHDRARPGVSKAIRTKQSRILARRSSSVPRMRTPLPAALIRLWLSSNMTTPSRISARLSACSQAWPAIGIGVPRPWSPSKTMTRPSMMPMSAIRLNPRFADAYFDRGNGFSGKADLDKALKDFDETLRLDPRHINVLCNLRQPLDQEEGI